MTVVAIDIGGSGSRIVAAGEMERSATGPGLSIPDGRADHPGVVESLASALGETGPVSAVAVGAAGLLAHGDAGAIARTVTGIWPRAVVVVASDAVTAVVGAWGETGGGVVAAGTGVIAFATDLGGTWLRADGWGHVLGDDGGAAWIGGRGLAAALRAVDGRPGGSAVLLDALREHHGDPARLPAAVRAAANPATLLAAFAPAVTGAALDGDVVAREIVETAARELADTGLSIMRDGIPPRLALVGGVAADAGIAEGFTRRVREYRPDLEVSVGAGAPLDGALRLARLAAEGRPLPSRPPYLTVHVPSPTLRGAS